MTQSLTLGFLSIARPTFDIPLAQAVTAQARDLLDSAGFTLTGPDALISTLEEARQAAQSLGDIDLLVLFQATFADSTMAVELAQAIGAPLLMWAIPEAPTGGRLRLNSLCGINLAGHALRRAGYSYKTIYADANDSVVVEKIRSVAQAGYVLRRLQGTQIGRIGEHPAGFDTCRVNYAELKNRFGVEIVQIALNAVFEQARQADPTEVETVREYLSPRLAGMDALDQPALNGTLGAYVTMRDLAAQKQLSGFAVRCWPEFFTELGCAGCGASSLLNDSLTPASCEADVNGTITQLMLQWISGEPAFGSDIVSFDMQQNTAVFWHCGKAPLSMADPDVQPRATVHSNRQLPLLMEFPLKPGRVTLARLSEATGSYRLVVGSGEVIKAPISFTGTSGVIRFDNAAQDVLDTILGEGLEHHLALTYGSHVEALYALADMLNIPVLHL